MNKPSEQELKELISEITGHEVSEIESETRFKEDLAMDSISVADLLASLEEDFEIIIPHLMHSLLSSCSKPHLGHCIIITP